MRVVLSNQVLLKAFLIFALILPLLVATGCSKNEELTPPLAQTGATFQIIADIKSEPAGMTGHQQVFELWSFGSHLDAIASETSGSVVRNGLIWSKEHSEQLDKCLKFFEAYERYKKIQPEVVKLISDPDVRYAIAGLNISKDDVDYASVWICSIKEKRVAFLSAD